jgi:hypothetical protein
MTLVRQAGARGAYICIGVVLAAAAYTGGDALCVEAKPASYHRAIR